MNIITIENILSAFLLLAGLVCLYYLLRFLELNLQPMLKHLQVYQVFRAQFLLPYTTDRTGRVWPRYTNQLGNNLFQYAYSRLRARYLGVNFAAGILNQDVFHADLARIKGGKGKKIPSFENANPFAKAVPFEHLDTRVDYSKLSDAKKDTKFDQRAKRFLSSKPNAFAQDFKFYSQDADLVRSWMCPSVEKHTKEMDTADALGVSRDDTIVFHLRFAGAVEGIFADPTYHELPMNFYNEVLLRHGKCNRAILVHDPKSRESAEEVARRLKTASPKLEVIQQCASRSEDFMVMYKARNLCLSISTFAWWAGFLGAKHKHIIYYPQHETVPWYSPRRLKTWYNRLMPNEAVYVPVKYTTKARRLSRSPSKLSISKSASRLGLSAVRSQGQLPSV
mmetsp:Transcript_16676/g.25082  ORF Transcript_16676/g.25082 Transcript_16676/m.25082 type:complete len:393 (+) Transcript_16676:94-1272(+)|eukprot:CAMPEP_0167761578 /NCGR_PEP_ID=MMETSP0110_2-20121227/12254_1 /TAXON_ID=629695 /ORGANISM="Gymnochlora sp., Strain CCMP2014" /LENGTH=392 /DNA_ID=CAMNT_0007648285 /DNA_START=52 /DNA_END=1230 /DNA_ORIENTATION=-